MSKGCIEHINEGRMKRLIIGLLCIMPFILCVENQQEERFFWQDKDGVDEKLIIQLLRLMNKCLELKLENELFPQLLQKVCAHLDTLGIECVEKERLQERIRNLLIVLKDRSHNETRSFEDFRKEMNQILYSFN